MALLNRARPRSLWIVAGLGVLIALAAPADKGPARAAALETIVDPTATSWQGTQAQTDAILDQIAATGSSTLRLQVTIGDPLSKLDYMIDGAEQRGLDVILTPAGPAPRNNTHLIPPAPRLSRFIAFVHQLGARYPEVDRWAIWNEPNLWKYFPLPRDMKRGRVGVRYRQLFLASERALAATGHPRSEVYIGETSPKVTRGSSDTFCLDRHRHRLHGRRPIRTAGWTQHPYIAARRPWLKSKLIGTGDAAPALLANPGLPGRSDYTPDVDLRHRVRRLRQPARAARAWAGVRRGHVAPAVGRSFAENSLSYDGFAAGFYDAHGQLEQAKLASFINPLFVYRRGSAVTLRAHLRNNPAGVALPTYHDPDGTTGTLSIQTDAEGYFQQSAPWYPGRAWSLVPGRWQGTTSWPSAEPPTAPRGRAQPTQA